MSLPSIRDLPRHRIVLPLTSNDHKRLIDTARFKLDAVYPFIFMDPDDVDVRGYLVRRVDDSGFRIIAEASRGDTGASSTLRSVMRGCHLRVSLSEDGEVSTIALAPPTVEVQDIFTAKPKAMIVDLDQTLIDNWTCRPALADLSTYHSLSLDCAPRRSIITLCEQAVSSGIVLVILTNRTEDARGITERWLSKHMTLPYVGPIMAPERSVAVEWKKRAYHQIISPDFEVVSAVDDLLAVSEMWHRLGIESYWIDPEHDVAPVLVGQQEVAQ